MYIMLFLTSLTLVSGFITILNLGTRYRSLQRFDQGFFIKISLLLNPIFMIHILLTTLIVIKFGEIIEEVQSIFLTLIL